MGADPADLGAGDASALEKASSEENGSGGKRVEARGTGGGSVGGLADGKKSMVPNADPAGGSKSESLLRKETGTGGDSAGGLGKEGNAMVPDAGKASSGLEKSPPKKRKVQAWTGILKHVEEPFKRTTQIPV